MSLDLFHNAVPLALSIVALGVGPLIHVAARNRPAAMSVLNGFVLASIVGLVVFFVVPQAIVAAGGWALGAAIVGLALPVLLERLTPHHDAVDAKVLTVALVGLLLHVSLDGVVLGTHHAHASDDLPIVAAIVLHRLPVGLALWWLVRPLYGKGRALLALAVVASLTVVGFSFGDAVTPLLSVEAFRVFEAFVGGSLLHVVAHRPTRPEGPRHVASAIGAFLGIGVLVAIPLLGHQHGSVDFERYGDTLLALSLEAAPALLLGYVLAGLFASFMPRASTRWLRRGGHAQQSARGMIFGLPIPICSCGVVPLYQSLVKRGVPVSAALAFLVATPELGIEALILSVPLLGWELTGIRLVAAAALAFGVAWGVSRLVDGDESVSATSGDEAASPPAQKQPLGDRLKRAWTHTNDVVDDTAAWIVVGVTLAAAFDPGLASKVLDQIPAGFDVAVFALLGIPLYVCASGATPIAAGMIAAGVSPGAALAFLLSGPATNVTTFGILSRLHGRRLAVLFGSAMTAGAIGLGLATNAILPSGLVSGVFTGETHEGTLLQWAALVALILMFAASIVRISPRDFVLGVLHMSDDHDDHDHGHDHDHAHDHDHEHDHADESAAASSSCCSSGCATDLLLEPEPAPDPDGDATRPRPAGHG